MPLGSRPATTIPPLTAQLVRANSPRGTTPMWIRDQLESLWSDKDFAH